MKNVLLPVVFFIWLSGITAALVWLLVFKEAGSIVINRSAEPTIPESNQDQTQGTDIANQLASLSARVQQLEQQVEVSPAPATPQSPASSISLPAREYYVPLGSGSTTNRDWTTLTGVGVNFDPSKYQPIKNIYFEAAGSIISGEVHVVLVDVTNNNVFWQGELVFNTSNPTWEQSVPLVLSSAPSQLQVQILSTNGESAVLNDSRLLIQTGY